MKTDIFGELLIYFVWYICEMLNIIDFFKVYKQSQILQSVFGHLGVSVQ